MTQDVMIRPIISEKSMDHAGKGKFTFEVVKEADKNEIKKAIEEKFKVKVLDVATMIVKGKKVKTGRRRVEVKKSTWKKAIVRLKEGQKIDLFEVGGQEATTNK